MVCIMNAIISRQMEAFLVLHLVKIPQVIERDTRGTYELRIDVLEGPPCPALANPPQRLPLREEAQGGGG